MAWEGIMARKLSKLMIIKTGKSRPAFTLIELLVVIAVVAAMTSILVPSLVKAKSHARVVVCKSNLRQLLLAGAGYAIENNDFYVPAAEDMWDNSGLRRWHGVRQNLNAPFDPSKGPLVTYLADGRVKQCPQKVDFVGRTDFEQNFESGCGAYGYNMAYIGSFLWQSDIGFEESYQKTTRTTQVSDPAQTLLFADCAMSLDDDNYIEYSFAEPVFAVYNGTVLTDMYMSPSIHFRHDSRACIGWADGHVSLRDMAKFSEENAYGITSQNMNLGWFEPLDNSLFDLD
jgi:prepilin-type N-terminal cleavage/methylation domain-containing protein/prepilin-type processing-associated H-X9-DG protein